jgi:hypothetical protein
MTDYASINHPEYITIHQSEVIDILSEMKEDRVIYNQLNSERNTLPLWESLAHIASPIVVQYIKDQWYEETLVINDPGPFAKSHLYRDGKLHVREGIEEILEYLTLRVKYADELQIRNKAVREKLYTVIEEYKRIFGIS